MNNFRKFIAETVAVLMILALLWWALNKLFGF